MKVQVIGCRLYHPARLSFSFFLLGALSFHVSFTRSDYGTIEWLIYLLFFANLFETDQN